MIIVGEVDNGRIFTSLRCSIYGHIVSRIFLRCYLRFGYGMGSGCKWNNCNVHSYNCISRFQPNYIPSKYRYLSLKCYQYFCTYFGILFQEFHVTVQKNCVNSEISTIIYSKTQLKSDIINIRTYHNRYYNQNYCSKQQPK